MITNTKGRAIAFGAAGCVFSLCIAYIFGTRSNLDSGHVTYIMTLFFLVFMYVTYNCVCAFSKRPVSFGEATTYLAAVLAFFLCISAKDIFIALPMPSSVSISLPEPATDGQERLSIHEIVVDGQNVNFENIALPDGWVLVRERNHTQHRVQKRRIETTGHTPLILNLPPASFVKIIFNEGDGMKRARIGDGFNTSLFEFPFRSKVAGGPYWPVFQVKSTSGQASYGNVPFCLRFGVFFLMGWFAGAFMLGIFRNNSTIAALIYSLVFCLFSAVAARRYLFDSDVIAETSGFNRKLVFIACQVVACVIFVTARQLFARAMRRCDYRQGFFRGFWLQAFLYAALSFTLLVFIWPGLWNWDEIWVWKFALHLEPLYFYNFLSTYFMVTSMLIIPSACGYVVVQLLVISLIFGYAFHLVEKITGTGWRTWILFAVALMPFIMTRNFHLYRNTLYGYLFLMLVLKCLALYRGVERASFFNVIFTAVLLAVIATWRSEGLPYLLIVPFCLFILMRKTIGLRRLALFSVVAIACWFGLNAVQKGGGNDLNRNYLYINSLMTLSLMLHMDLDPDTRDADLALIGRGINVDVLARYPDATEVPAWWQANRELIPPNRTGEDHQNYFKGWMSLVWHNPGAFLRARVMSYAMYYEIAPYVTGPIAYNGYRKPAHEVPRSHASLYFLSTLYPEIRQITPEAAKTVDRCLSLNYQDSLVGRLLFFLCYRSLYYAGPLLNLLLLAAAIIRKNKPLLLLELSLFYFALVLFLAGPAVKTIYFFPYLLAILVVHAILLIWWWANGAKRRQTKVLS